MPKSDFKMRSTERDHASDRVRFQRACRGLSDVLNEIRAEADGLERRYMGAGAAAAFAFQAYEDGGDPRLSEKADDRIVAMGHYEQRRGELAVQEALLDDLLRKLHPFAAMPGNGEGEPPPQRWPGTGRLARLIGIMQRA